MNILPAWLALCLIATPASAGASLGGDFTLSTAAGQPVSLASLRGKVVLIYFGFTRCPDLCPAELLRYKQLMTMLPPASRQHVQPVFVSLDPERDRAVLEEYVRNFGAYILALTGSEAQLREVTARYAVRFRHVPTGSGYTVDHSVNTYLVDPAGRLVRILPPGTPAEAMLEAVVRYLP